MDNEKFQELILQQLQALINGQKEIRKDITKLETRIENEVMNKLGAFFDAREVQNDRFDRICEAIDAISTDTRYLVARVAKLERLAK
jgi:hypothetical protein